MTVSKEDRLYTLIVNVLRAHDGCCLDSVQDSRRVAKSLHDAIGKVFDYQVANTK